MGRPPIWVPLVCGILAAAQVARAQSSPALDFTQVTRPVVVVADPELIDFLLFELFIEPTERPTRVQVIDVTLNGYGPDDVIVLYPSFESFMIPELLPDSVQKIMSSWAPEVEYKLDSGNLPSEALVALIGSDGDSASRAEKAILYDVVQAVERNYRDLPIGILYERDSVGFTFQMWDYSPHAMQYIPRPTFDSDNAVQSALDVLKQVGYVPGRSALAGGAAFSRPANGIAPVANVLFGIRNVPDEPTRQLAARIVLLGSYDFDRSGAIDAPREIDAFSCDVWAALDAAFPGFLYRFGFTDPTSTYFGNLLFSVSEVVRHGAAARGVACGEGRPPPVTVATAPAPRGRAGAVPPPVTDFLPTQAAAEVVRGVGSAEAGSAAWAEAVKSVLLEHFDGDGSGLLDRAAELDSIPCEVWQAVAATHDTFLPDLGLVGAGLYLGDRIGIEAEHRRVVRERVGTCLRQTGPTAARRVRSDAAPRRQTEGRRIASSQIAPALAGLSDVTAEHDRQLAARMILLSEFDVDRSGYIDTASELDAMSCEVWKALDDAFPGLAPARGFVDDSTARQGPFFGSIIFNISTRLRVPAGRRATACLRGQTPPATDPAEVEAATEVVRIPTALQEFLATETAVRIVRLTSRLEQGSTAWASAVRSVLLEEYDLNRSGMIDARAEIEAIPCVVWETVQSTYGGSLSGLGFGMTGPYLGNHIGVAEDERIQAGNRILGCAS